jgi:hypothetical protein
MKLTVKWNEATQKMSKYQINTVHQQKELDFPVSLRTENYHDSAIKTSSRPSMSDSFTILLLLIASLDAVSSHFLWPVRLPTFGLDPNKEIASCDQKIVSAIHLKLNSIKF